MATDPLICFENTTHGQLNLFPGQAGHAWNSPQFYTALQPGRMCQQQHLWAVTQQKAAVPYMGHVLPRQLLSLSWEGTTGEKYLRWDVHAALPDLCPSGRPDRTLRMSSAMRWLHKCPHWWPQPLVLVSEIFQPNSWTSPWLEENISPSLKAHSTPVTAAEVTVEKNSSVWENTAVNLSLQFIIRTRRNARGQAAFLVLTVASHSLPLLEPLCLQIAHCSSAG